MRPGPANEPDSPPVIELRIHGFGGSTVKEMLGRDPEPMPLKYDADQTSGFWSWSHSKDGVERQAYLWGRYPAASLGLWLALLPFTLVNVAGWTVGSGSRTGDDRSMRRRWGAIVSRWAVALLGVSLTAGWTLWMVLIVGDRLALSDGWPGYVRIAWAVVALAFLSTGGWWIVRPRFDPRRTRSGTAVWLVAGAAAALLAVSGGDLSRGWARAIAVAAAALATAGPFLIAGANSKRFEQYRARLGGTGVARERRRLGDEETLGAPCFYDHPTDSSWLLLLHGFVAAVILAIVVTRVALLPSAGADASSLLGEPGAATPFLGHGLLFVGYAQGLLVALLMVAGAVGTSRSSAGRHDSISNAVVNALRPAALAGIGVFLFTAVVGLADGATDQVLGRELSLRTHPELELTPAFIGGACIAGVMVAALALLARTRSEDPPADVPSPAKWRDWQMVRWMVANADYLITMTGVVLAISLALSMLAHRGWSPLPVVPQGKFRGPETFLVGQIWLLGGIAVLAPTAIFALALRYDRFRSSVAAVWDVLSFWPRRFHPLGVPPESERSVPEVQSYLLHAVEDSHARVQIVAHSQGSVIAFAALVGLRDRGALSQMGLITLGSPLFALYPRMFPAQVSKELTDELASTLDQRWLNLHRPSDYFGIPPEDVEGIENEAVPYLPDRQVPRIGPPEFFSRRKAERLIGRRYQVAAEYCGVEAGAVGTIVGVDKIDSERRLYGVRIRWEEMSDGAPLDPGRLGRAERFSRRDLYKLAREGSGPPQRMLVPREGPEPDFEEAPLKLIIHHGYWDLQQVKDRIAVRNEELRRTVASRLPVVPSFAPRRRMVSWLDPRLLALTGYQALVSAMFGKWADARHVQAIDAKPAAQSTIEHSAEEEDEVWVDFVADVGDAFASTFAVASALAQRSLQAGETSLRRGHILVMGGDQVYPAASRERYENQLVGPYALASRCVDVSGVEAGEPPLLLAIPGNHDWYDGLGSFDQVFCAGSRIGMWQTRQERSYWAVRLTPADVPDTPTWWVWGVDLQLGNRFDRRQLGYFEEQALALREGDFVILCSPIPTWAHAGAEPTEFDVLSRLVAEVARPARVVMHLSGDAHHFARYERQQLKSVEGGKRVPAPRTDGLCRVQYVTSGGGGAFTSPTHHLDEFIDLPVPYDEGETTLSLQSRGGTGEPTPQPGPWGSRRLIAKNLLPSYLRQNLSFALVPGAAAAVAAFAAFRRPRQKLALGLPDLRQFAGDLLSNPIGLVLIILVLAGWTAFAKPRRGGGRLVARIVGLVHGFLQVVVMATVVWVSPWIVGRLHDFVAPLVHGVLSVTAVTPSWIVEVIDWVALLTVAGGAGGLAGATLLAIYLVASNLVVKMHDNEAASAVADQGSKHFLRLRICKGTATVWVLHVLDQQRIAEQFAAHDPRARRLESTSKVKVWDRFEVGRASTGEATDG